MLTNSSIAHGIILTTDGSYLNLSQRETETGDALIILLRKHCEYTLGARCIRSAVGKHTRARACTHAHTHTHTHTNIRRERGERCGPC